MSTKAEGVLSAAAAAAEGSMEVSGPGVVVLLLDNAGAWVASKCVAGQFTASPVSSGGD